MKYSAEQVIEAIYQAALGRPSDDVGRQNYASILAKNPGALLDIAKSIGTSLERNISENISSISDHSQFGEFSKLIRRLIRSGSRHGIIVDVGARGKDRSNSFDLLSLFDWRGILVEANPALYGCIESEFIGTDYNLVKCAIGIEEGKMPFYIGANDDVSSLLSEHASGWGDLRGEINVPVRRLAPLLNELEMPNDFDVLSLDIEGLDVAVLNDLIGNSAFRPKYVIIEASYSFTTRCLKDVKASPRVCFEYDIVDQTEANLILERSI